MNIPSIGNGLRAAATILPFAILPVSIAGQSGSTAQAPSTPRFEVVSIKLNANTGDFGAVSIPGSRPGEYFRSASSIRALIQQAWQMPFVRQIGGPEWIREDTYIVNAKYPDDVPRTPENTRLMLRALLMERLKLVAREETRELPIYALTFAREDKRLGPKLQPFTLDCAAPDADRQKCGSQIGSRPGMITGRRTGISNLASTLEFATNRTVVDRTGLAGQYSFEVAYAPESAAASELPSLYTALQEQLGLKLESERAPVKVLVIDSIERPSEN